LRAAITVSRASLQTVSGFTTMLPTTGSVSLKTIMHTMATKHLVLYRNRKTFSVDVPQQLWHSSRTLLTAHSMFLVVRMGSNASMTCGPLA
jgi:hypothetical protein